IDLVQTSLLHQLHEDRAYVDGHDIEARLPEQQAVSSRAGSSIQDAAPTERERRFFEGPSAFHRLEPLDRALAREGAERSAGGEAHGTLPRPGVAEGARMGVEGLRPRPAPHPPPQKAA